MFVHVLNVYKYTLSLRTNLITNLSPTVITIWSLWYYKYTNICIGINELARLLIFCVSTCHELANAVRHGLSGEKGRLIYRTLFKVTLYGQYVTWQQLAALKIRDINWVYNRRFDWSWNFVRMLIILIELITWN